MMRLLDLDGVFMGGWDGKVTFVLQALDGLVKALLHRCELKTQIFQLLV